MKEIMKTVMTASLLLVTLTATAQSVKDIEKQMGFQITDVIDHGVEVTKSLGQERDILKEGKPLKWRCDIYSFTLPKKQRYLLDEMIEEFETNGRENPNCYGINSMSESKDGDRVGHERNLMVGDDPNRFVAIGKDYTNFININILDDADTTKSHRYAYALEWRDGNKGATDVRYIVTYAKIPSATTTITDQNWPFLDLGKSNVRKGGPILFKGNALVLWNDTLEHDTDPVTDVVIRLHQGQPVTADDLLCNDNILLVFSLLKQQFLAGQNTEFNAISVYTLCKRAREYGFFSSDIPDVPNGKAELEQLKRDIVQMKANAATDTIRNYLQMAIAELDKIK